MPRKKRQTRTGQDAQNIGSVPGQRYGEGVEQQAMQRAMPAPDVTGNVPSPTLPDQPLVGATGARPPSDPQAIAQYLGANNPALLGQTQRPQEPITAGLSSGPGAGPDALTMGRSTSPIGRFFDRLSTETGNPEWRRLKERAGM